MDDVILITELNDFIFCPISIYFHKLYGDTDRNIYQNTSQINGTKAHETIDEKRISNMAIIAALDVYSSEFHLSGKIDIYDAENKTLTERKKKIVNIYDGYIYQLYAQYYCMIEMGYEVKELFLYSIDDNKKFPIALPEDNPEMSIRFCETIQAIMEFSLEEFEQTNKQKCHNCIYEPACDRSN